MVRISSALCVWRPDHGLEARIVEPGLEPECPAQPGPELRQLHVEVEMAVARGVDPRHAVPEEVPDRLGRLLRLGPERAAGLHRQHAVQQRGVDPLARPGLAAGDEGEQDAGYGQAPRVVVDEAAAHELRRCLAGRALLPGQAAVGLHDRIEPGPLRQRADLAERGHGAVDEPRVLGAERPVVEPEAGGDTRPEALDEHVRGPREPSGDGQPLRMLQVDREAALAAIDAEEVAGEPGERRGVGAERVALERLQLVDASAVGREERGRDGARDDRGAVDDAEALEGTGHRSAPGRARGQPHALAMRRHGPSSISGCRGRVPEEPAPA